MAGWYELSRSSNSQYYFVLKAGNGEIILTSEQYPAKASAQAGIASVQVNSPIDERYVRNMARDARFYFTLKAANHQVIGTSQMYVSASGRDNGIESVKVNGPTKTVKDNT